MNRLPRWIAVWLVAVMVLSPLARAQNSAEPDVAEAAVPCVRRGDRVVSAINGAEANS